MEVFPSLAEITRFISRRGRPHTIIFDNCTNFVGAAKEFKQYIGDWNQSSLEESLAQRLIKWKFNTPGAPHIDGVWERSVRSCKIAMFSILGSRNLTEDNLNTTTCLVEQTVNARPLFSVSGDPSDLEAYADMIWTRWSEEYLPQWNRKHKWNRLNTRELKLNDLVWILDEFVKRSHYKMGIIGTFPRQWWDCPISDSEDKGRDNQATNSQIGASLLRWCFRERKQGRRCWRSSSSDSKWNCIQQMRATLSRNVNFGTGSGWKLKILDIIRIPI